MRIVPFSHAMFSGAVSLEWGEGWVKPWRIPCRQRELFPPDALQGRAEYGSGVHLRFQSTTTRITLDVAPIESVRSFDLMVADSLAGVQHTVHLPPGEQRVEFTGLRPQPKSVELYLPAGAPVILRSLSIDAESTFDTPPDQRPHWVTYGSSITQSSNASSPSRTWPVLVARANGFRLTNLGFGSNAHAEPMMARLIGELSPDYITLCFGVNIHSLSSLSPRTLTPFVIGFLTLIRDKVPTAPIAVLSALVSPPREQSMNAAGYTLARMREDVSEAVVRLQTAGDKALIYVDGLSLFHPSEVDRYLPDQVHPNDEGYRILAERFGRQVVAPLKAMSNSA